MIDEQILGGDFKSLCEPDIIDKKLIKLDHVYNVYPAMYCHFVKSGEQYDPNTYVVLGTCGVPSVYGGLMDYDLHVWKQWCSPYRGAKRNDDEKYFRGLVCLLDAEAQCEKLTDAIMFVPMIGESFMFNNTYADHPEEKNSIQKNMLNVFNNFCMGKILSNLENDQNMLNQYQGKPFRMMNGQRVMYEGTNDFLGREKVIAQVLCKYDMTKANDFEKQILVNLYDNAVHLLDNYIKVEAKKRDISVTEFQIKPSSASFLSKLFFKKAVNKALKTPLSFTEMINNAEMMVKNYDENLAREKAETENRKQNEINKKAGKIKI